jgi:elongator complex protein 3
MSEAILGFLVSIAKIRPDAGALGVAKREFAKRFKRPFPANTELLGALKRALEAGLITADEADWLRRCFRRRTVRTMSGVAPVAVLTKPYACPGRCAYCPNLPGVPVSYLPNEPAVMRAIQCGFDPYRQVLARLKALEANGHLPNKIEIIVIGGTWSYLPDKYQYWYVLNLFRAVNDFSVFRKSQVSALREKSPYLRSLSLGSFKKYLAIEQKRNESAAYRIIGLTVETRPDHITDAELGQLREFGCTRVEIGVQATDDEILKLNRRGHNVAAVAAATSKLRAYGFKITYHFMPALPGSNPEKDVAMFSELFSDVRFQPDQIKFYPTVVVRGSLLYKWWKQGKYQPYSDAQLQDVITRCKAVVPEYVRIIRLIRDIPSESIMAGNTITNLRQIMQSQGLKCSCIRCREAKNLPLPKDYKIKTESYAAGAGLEYFISAVSQDNQTLFGFVRLYLDKAGPIAPALVRELHVYGELVPIGGVKKIQHAGLGAKLLLAAEKLARSARAEKIAVISGVGARGYYRKSGYRLKDSYMLKNLK